MECHWKSQRNKSFRRTFFPPILSQHPDKKQYICFAFDLKSWSNGGSPLIVDARKKWDITDEKKDGGKSVNKNKIK